MLELILGIVGLVIAILTLVFTDQGREVLRNVRYYTLRLAHVPGRLRRRRTPAASPNESGDRSAFVADVTIPDGTKVLGNSRFAKVWGLRSIGSVFWSQRYLQRQGPIEGPGRLNSPLRVRIPSTEPGQSCRVSVPLTAPPLPGHAMPNGRWSIGMAESFFRTRSPYMSLSTLLRSFEDFEA